jgi:hypothetical protein
MGKEKQKFAEHWRRTLVDVGYLKADIDDKLEEFINLVMGEVEAHDPNTRKNPKEKVVKKA